MKEPKTSQSRHPHRFLVFLEQVKVSMRELGLTQVRTPNLVKCGSLEATIEPLRVRCSLGDWQLPSSPEISLKKILAHGELSDIFEVSNCFRSDLPSSIHATEFHMLEWYRAGKALDALIDDCRGLFSNFYGGVSPDWQIVSVAQLFEQYLGLNLAPSTEREELAGWVKQCVPEVSLSPYWSRSDCFHILFSHRIESELAKQPDIFIVKDYPNFEAAYAQVAESGWAQRFEIYWRGVELANAYNELLDPKVYRQRFAEHKKNGEFLIVDEDFFAAMDKGLPSCSGIALGLERLYMVLNDVKDIKDLSFLL